MTISSIAATSAYSNMANIGGAMLTGLSSKTASIAEASTAQSFPDLVSGVVGSIKSTLQHSERVASQSLVKEASLVDVVDAVNSADMALQEIVAFRDRFITAYQDILKMPI